MTHKSLNPLESRINSYTAETLSDYQFAGPSATTAEYKSGSEEMIAGILERERIRFTYEDPVRVETKSRRGRQPRIWHSDFHLHESGIFVEYVGLPDDKEYMEGIEKKKQVYEKMGKTVVWLFSEDIWQKSDGRYRKRRDAEQNVLQKIYMAMRTARTENSIGYGGAYGTSNSRQYRIRATVA